MACGCNKNKQPVEHYVQKSNALGSNDRAAREQIAAELRAKLEAALAHRAKKNGDIVINAPTPKIVT